MNDPDSSALAPFRSRTFLTLWIVTVISNTGTWMHDVGAGWLMTSLSPSPLMVSLVQTATTLPVFLCALPAGALADIIDKRRLLITAQTLMLLLTSAFTVLVATQRMTPQLLLAFTFLLGVSAAFVAPAWQAIAPMLVQRRNLQAAITLNVIGVNISRSIGPALSGLLIAGIGIFAPFALNAVSFVVVIVALLRWKPAPAAAVALPAERFWDAMTLGLRYARHSDALKTALVRTVAFFLFASAFLSLLPLHARLQLNGDAGLYGVLLGCVGAGAVGGALLMPALKKMLNADQRVVAGTLLVVAALLINALLQHALAAAIAGGIFGCGWIIVLSALNVAVQMALPDWVRARGLSVYLMTFFGAMSGGSVLWGAVATATSLTHSMLLAAGGAVLAMLLGLRARLGAADDADNTPSLHWPAPLVAVADAHDRGPVMTMIEYCVAADDADKFADAVTQLSQARRRNGAYAWGVLQDAADPERHVEYFFEASWLQHLRHHERVSGDDAVVQKIVQSLHCGSEPPRVTHLLGARSGLMAPTSRL